MIQLRLTTSVVFFLHFQLSAMIVVRPTGPDQAAIRLQREGVLLALWEGPPPYFLEDSRGANVTAQLGQEVQLHCRVNDLGDKTVSWVKRHGQTFELLTFGHLTYSSEERYSLSFVEPNDWKLIIKNVQSKDAGLYECQVSSHPPLARCTYLIVLVPQVEIVDSSGSRVGERFYRLGSTIELACVGTAPAYAEGVAAARMLWMFGGRALNHDTTRGGVSVKTESTESGLVSQLHVAGARRSDAGSYECVLSDVRASVIVHVLAGEYADAMQYGAGKTWSPYTFLQTFVFHLFFNALLSKLFTNVCLER